MFVSEQVPALFKKGTLKLEKTEDGFRRVAECTLMIEPFPLALARELGEEVAAHLFTDEGQIRGELESIELRPRMGLMRLSAQLDRAMEPVVELDEASVKDLSAKVMEDKASARRWLSFSFVVVFSLQGRAARNFVIDEFGKTLLWSFRPIQADLLASAKAISEEVKRERTTTVN